MNKKGFTLIEMLVVIAIIAILVSIIIPTVSNSTKKAKEAADVANIRSAVAQYQIDNLNGNPDWDSVAPVIKVTANYTAPSDSNNWTITYVAETLTDGNGANANTYTWTLGDLLTETTTPPATTTP